MTNIDWEKEAVYISERKEITKKIKEVIVTSLNLEISSEIIQDDQPLFGRGLELDSIDALELSMHITKEFDVDLSDDDMLVWSSVNRLADYIMEQK